MNDNNSNYGRIYPTGANIDKNNTPIRPLVSGIGSVTYRVSKELAWILKPLVGKSKHHANNIQEHYTRNRGMHHFI